MKKLLLISSVFILFGFSACSLFTDWQTQHPDNEVEEFIEDEIEEATGADIDLTPMTGPEKQNLHPYMPNNEKKNI